MDRASPALRKMFTDIRNLWFEKMGRELRNFSIELSDFLYDLTNHPTNGWHDRFHAFTAGQRFQGRYMTPESEEALLDYISHWAAMQVASEHAVEMPEVTFDSDAFELTESERARAREGLPWWYAKPFEWGDGEWEEKFTELANVARDKLLATCRELQTLGSLARNADQLPEDGIDALEPHIARVRAAHDEYVQALIDIERTWLAYIKGHWYVGWQVEQLMLKIAGDLPPRLFDLQSPKLPLLAQARAEVGHALDKVVKRVNTTYTVAVWTDRTITVLEFATGVGGVAKTVAKKAIAKGVAKEIAVKMAVKAGIKQAAIQGAVLVGSMYAIPPLLAYAGLHPDFVFAGVVVLQGLTAIKALRSVGAKDANVPTSRQKELENQSEAPPVRGQPPTKPARNAPHRNRYFRLRVIWSNKVQFRGTQVYQRNDLIDPLRLDSRGRTSLDRMKKGLAPIDVDGKPIELHHMLQTNDSPIAEVTRKFHISQYNTIHINPRSTPSGIDRRMFDAWRVKYWQFRARDFE